MRIFLAGATGAIGRPLVDVLVAAGHEVTGTTRDQARADALRERGVTPVVLDAFDADAVHAAVRAAAPEVVIHQLTALPADPNPRRMADAVALTGRLRRETVPTFVAAAHAAGARRILVQSISFVTRPDGRPDHDEEAPLAPGQEDVAAMEAAVLGAPAGLDALSLRYGFFYGPGTWYAPDGAIGQMIAKRRFPLIGSMEGRSSFIHVDDAVAATVRALDRGPTGIYNITGDEPLPQRVWLPHAAQLMGAKRPRHVPAWLAQRLAGETVVHYAQTLPGNLNGRAVTTLEWRPRRWRDGFAEVFGRA
jgi:nucleoside-diphosphate-sugar epimerase